MGRLVRDGVALFFRDVGKGAPPLIFVHSLGDDHRFFASQCDHFGREHRVVAIDLRGHGQSDAPQQGYGLPALAEELAWMCYEMGLYKVTTFWQAFCARAHRKRGREALSFQDSFRTVGSLFRAVSGPARTLGAGGQPP